MKNLKKVLLRGILSCMMVSAATAITAYADYVINVEDKGISVGNISRICFIRSDKGVLPRKN